MLDHDFVVVIIVVVVVVVAMIMAKYEWVPMGVRNASQ